MVDKECLECKRYYSKSCKGIEDRGRNEITIKNSCSGFLKIYQHCESANEDYFECMNDYYDGTMEV